MENDAVIRELSALLIQAGGVEGVINITMNVAGSKMERDFTCKVGRGKPFSDQLLNNWV